MAAVLGIVRGHQGAIKIYSELTRGSSFKILFPCSEFAASMPADVEPNDSKWRGSGTILVVDDEESVRTTAKCILELQGFDVITAKDGHEALNVFQQEPNKVKLVLTDLTMPHMGGEEVFREFRQLRPDISVILMSGYNEQEIANLFAGKGLAGFVQKPFRAEELQKTVQQALHIIGTP